MLWVIQDEEFFNFYNECLCMWRSKNATRQVDDTMDRYRLCVFIICHLSIYFRSYRSDPRALGNSSTHLITKCALLESEHKQVCYGSDQTARDDIEQTLRFLSKVP